jgi:hypothetical protein
MYAPIPITQDNIHLAVREWLADRVIACGIYGAIDTWNTTSVTSMTSLFRGGAKDFQDNIGNWDVSNVVTMERMFVNSNSPFDMGLSAWNVSHVENFSEMFLHASGFNEDLSSWKLASANRGEYV